jgi:hypothetical protein
MSTNRARSRDRLHWLKSDKVHERIILTLE